MRCDSARLALSTGMDDSSPFPSEVVAHVHRCKGCAAFETGAWRVRSLTRLQPAPPVPDLVPTIMARVREETSTGPIRVRRRRPPRLQPWPRRVMAMAAAAGLVAGFVLTAGGFVRPRSTDTAALAEEIPGRLVSAAEALRGYRATFDITEMHWTKEVWRRTFVAMVAFRAPESLRVVVRDTTSYPSPAWPRNDLRLATDGRTWRESGPDPCPRAELPACTTAAPVDRSILDRAPFDSSSALPTDIIVPMTVLAASNRLDVVGLDHVTGRDAVAVRLPYEEATSLFQYLQFLGSWRPFFPQDRVVVWLDRTTWFPLRYEVYPASGPQRALWATQNGLPQERSARPVFVAQERSLSTDAPSARSFAVTPGPGASDEGFHDVNGLGPATPDLPSLLRTGAGTLALWRQGSFDRTPARPFEESITAYTHGLSWLTVTRVMGWRESRLFGVGPFAEPVILPEGHGVGYYEPATSDQPRRVAVHTSDGEVLLAANIPLPALLAAVRAFPFVGMSQPPAWRVHRGPLGEVEDGLTQDQAIAARPLPALLPTSLPRGYQPAAAEIVRGPGRKGITLVYRRPAAELDGTGIRVYQASGETLPPPSGPDQQVVAVRGTLGRWSPDAHMLEWVEGGLYQSITAPTLDLGDLLGVAGSLRFAEPAGAAP